MKKEEKEKLIKLLQTVSGYSAAIFLICEFILAFCSSNRR